LLETQAESTDGMGDRSEVATVAAPFAALVALVISLPLPSAPFPSLSSPAQALSRS
jgi:hypothetical protein